MTVRKFKPGDRVQKRGANQIMIVQKYALKHDLFIGTYLSQNEVMCVWYENGERKIGSFDQRTLYKVTTPFTTLISDDSSVPFEKEQVKH